MKTKNTLRPVVSVSGFHAAIPATAEQLVTLGLTPEEITAGEKRFKMSHHGPWQICAGLSAVVEIGDFTPGQERKAFFPVRAMSAPKESGYAMEGRVSLGGRKYSAFTASQLFELPDGRLVNVATVFLRGADALLPPVPAALVDSAPV